MPRTLLLTDIVDSTRLTRELGDERMAEVWMAHDKAARQLLQKHNGREADRTDGFLMQRSARTCAVTAANWTSTARLARFAPDLCPQSVRTTPNEGTNQPTPWNQPFLGDAALRSNDMRSLAKPIEASPRSLEAER